MRRDLGERDPGWAGITGEVIDVRGTAVNVLRAGRPGTGVPQLLVHGLGGSSTNWIEVMLDLAEHGEVVAPDLPGFGRTRPPVPGASRVRANARFLRALLDTLGWQRAVVHGNSMGGTIATLFTDLAPERVAGLALVAPALPTPKVQMVRLSREAATRFMPLSVPYLGRAAALRTLRAMTAEELWADARAVTFHDPDRLRPALVELSLENTAYAVATPWRVPATVTAGESLVAALLGARELRRALDRADVPGVVVWGDRDRLVGRPVIDEIARRRPEWSVVELDEVGHVPMMETPDRYAKAVEPLLSSVATS